MPHAPPTRCNTPGCPELIPPGTSRCPTHTRPAWTSAPSHWHGRDLTHWRKLRAAQLRREPRCRACGQPATQVDHITPLADGGSFTDPTNHESLCDDCHDHKTRAENAARNRRRRRTQ